MRAAAFLIVGWPGVLAKLIHYVHYEEEEGMQRCVIH